MLFYLLDDQQLLLNSGIIIKLKLQDQFLLSGLQQWQWQKY